MDAHTSPMELTLVKIERQIIVIYLYPPPGIRTQYEDLNRIPKYCRRIFHHISVQELLHLKNLILICKRTEPKVVCLMKGARYACRIRKDNGLPCAGIE